MLSDFYAQLFERIIAHRRALLVLVVSLSVGGCWLCASLPFDMSFRPLLSRDPRVLAATNDFEAIFGQESGAHIGVVLQTGDVFDDEFIRRLDALSTAVAQLPHVIDTVSLTQLFVPEWSGQKLRTRRWPVDDLNYSKAGATLRTFAQAQPLAINALLSDDFSTTLVWARVDLPMQALAERRDLIQRFASLVEQHIGDSAVAHMVGVSVVEAAYARIVLESLVRSIGITVVLIVLLLALVLGDIRSASIVLAGMSLAIPLTLGVMRLTGQAVTIMNSMVPTLVLVVGVADAVHMLLAYRERRAAGDTPEQANAGMFAGMALPCLLTTVTSVAGFLSLQVASLPAIGDFGLNVAIGVVLVYCLNQILVPTLLHLWPPRLSHRPGFVDRATTRMLSALTALLQRRATAVSLVVGVLFLAVAAALPRLTVQQRFNEELPESHPIRVGQSLLEEHFGGILGPELQVSRVDGASLLGSATASSPQESDTQSLTDFTAELKVHEDVLSVRSYRDFLVPGTPAGVTAEAFEPLRHGPLRSAIRSTLNEDGTSAGIVVRTRDIGSKQAQRFVDDVNTLAAETLGSRFQVTVIGQWWLAQIGMSQLLRDMIRSFALACLIVVPLLVLILRRWDLLLVSVIGNILPMLFALGFMALNGITLRIGTSMILAIALGIAIDDTIHLLTRLSRDRTADARQRVGDALHHTGRALVYTTVILVVGFGSMATSSFLAIRDMGIVGAATFAVALLADLVLVPGLYLVIKNR